jgi:hypothetical protein
MMKFLALAFCFLFGASGTVAFAGPADEANAVIDQWSATYSANDRDALVGLYAPDAVLLGTTSPVFSGIAGKRSQELDCRDTNARPQRDIRLGNRILQFCSSCRERYTPAITLYFRACEARRSMDDRAPPFVTAVGRASVAVGILGDILQR